MERILLVTDDRLRSAGLARDLGGNPPCEVHDLYADAAPEGAACALVADLGNLDAAAAARLRGLRARVRGGGPLVVLLHRDSQQARLLALALGATHTVCAPFDPARLRETIGTSRALAEFSDRRDPLPAGAVRAAAAARGFFTSVFVPGRPITPCAVEPGTAFIGRAVRDTGIRDWVRAVRQFDDITHQHCLLVAGLAAAFASSLGLGDRECHRLTRAALLHDVGKIHVPSAILNKPGRLDEAETAVVRRHPEIGHAMLRDQSFEPEVLAVVRSHHEMLDGSGYPDGLRADAIPDLVRLVTVCDIYAALIEYRPYKAPKTSAAAFEILTGMAGRLDPAVVDAFRPVVAAFTPTPLLDA